MWQIIGIIFVLYIIVDVVRGGPWRKIILTILEGMASSGSSGSSSDSGSREWKIKDRDSGPRSGGGSSGGGGASSDF